ncbi:hypothetical protein IM543_11395 [Massilia sp. UMI-21]|nr:hypothetical protein IM543_11395 [Massilia sp. UMI-21]
MACNCKKDIEEKLLNRFKEMSPEATGHQVSLTGYALILGDKLEQKGCMTISAEAAFPLKKGGTKAKKQTQNMIFTFCPFCGVKYSEEVAA